MLSHGSSGVLEETSIGSVAGMATFTYGAFSDEARDAVLTAADIALSAGSDTVMPEHLVAAVKGATRSARPARDLGRVPFHDATVNALHRAHDAAVEAAKAVDLGHLVDALSEPGEKSTT